MNIPAAVVNLHKSHPAFGQTPGHETTVGKRAPFARLLSVKFVGALRFLGEVRQLRHRRLHAKRHFKLSDANQSLWIANLLVLNLVELSQRVKHTAANLGGNAIRIVDVQYRVAARAKRHTRVLRRQKTGAPQTSRDSLHVGLGMRMSGV